MEVYIIQECIAYEAIEIQFVTTDSSKAFEYLHESRNGRLKCEIWENDKVVGRIDYNLQSKKWELK